MGVSSSKTPNSQRVIAGPGLARSPLRVAKRRSPRQSLAPGVEIAILDRATRLSEGEVRPAGDDEAYFGSTMLTIELRTLKRLVRIKDETELLALLEGSVRLRILAMRAAREEAIQRVGHRRIGTADVETSLSIHREALCIDVDIEIPLVHDVAKHG